MKLIGLLVAVFGLGTLMALGSTAALAHGESVTVEPESAKPGDTITVKGAGLGATKEVEVRLVSTTADIDLGEVETDADGAFTAQFKLPAGLAPGSYQLRAIGEESATADFRVLVAGGAESQATSMEEIPVRDRPLVQTIGLVALFGVLAGLGLYFARTAREPSPSTQRSPL